VSSIVAGDTDKIAAWVTAGAAQKQSWNGRAVLGGLIGWTHHQHLVQRKLCVVPVPTGYVILAFEIRWRQTLLVNDLFAYIWDVMGQGFNCSFTELISRGIGPTAF
jgi:hypothetical protein